MLPPVTNEQTPALIDAGNTAIKLYQRTEAASSHRGVQLLERRYRPVRPEDWYQVLRSHGIHHARWVSSWPEDEQQRWQHTLAEYAITLEPLQKETFLACVPHWNYALEELGLDRIMGISAVYPYTTPETGVILISAGTATCVEVVTHLNGYLGGWIQPGLRAWCDAMKQPAPHLPVLEASTLRVPETALGYNTATALACGLVNPYLLGLARSVATSVEAAASPTLHWRLITTGGHATTLRELGLIEALHQALCFPTSLEDMGNTPELLALSAFQTS
jgi:pantothenate kinase type III